MEEGSGAPAGPAWLAQWPAGPRPSEGGGFLPVVLFYFVLFILFCIILVSHCYSLVKIQNSFLI